MYEYHPETEELTYVQTICDDVVWDSYITEAFGEPVLFTNAKNDNFLDIYRWDALLQRYVPGIEIPSQKRNSRLGGFVFEYKGAYYYPAQDCSKVYGGAIDIKRVEWDGVTCKVYSVRHIESPHPEYWLGMHTLNEYKGVAVIDVHGYRYGMIGAVIAWFVKVKKMILHVYCIICNVKGK